MNKLKEFLLASRISLHVTEVDRLLEEIIERENLAGLLHSPFRPKYQIINSPFSSPYISYRSTGETNY